MTTPSSNHLDELLSYLQQSRGVDLNAYKRSTLGRRIHGRMQSLGIATPGDYIDYLEVHPDEFASLLNTILINVTSFFRDPQTWEQIANRVIPAILAEKDPMASIRVWSAGCSSGEEPFTIAMLFAEALGEEAYRARVKIYATDVDEEALAQARQATYTKRALSGVPESLLEKYWEPAGDHHTFRGELRRNVIFGRHDLTTDAPISRVDLLVSRNTLMYFNAEAQQRIMLRFHFALSDTGRLFLGRAETLLSRGELFEPEDLRSRIFVKVPRVPTRERLAALAPQHTGDHVAGAGAQPGLATVAFEGSPSAGIVIDAETRVRFANRRARELFGITSSQIGRALQDLAVSYRPTDLRTPIDEALSERRPALISGVRLEGRDQRDRWLDIHVTPLLSSRGVPIGASIQFLDVTRERTAQLAVEDMRHELETAYEELQSSNEELETTNEELQSAIEELETTNEELQAANEELETINEELQSTNEELETVNVELNERSGQLDATNAFFQSILHSLPTGVIVLGMDFRIRAWNGQSEEFWGVRPEEAEGKHIHELDIGLPTELFADALGRGLRGISDVRTVSAMNRRGRELVCRVSIEPLRGQDQLEGILVQVAEVDGAMDDPAAR